MDYLYGTMAVVMLATRSCKLMCVLVIVLVGTSMIICHRW